MSAPTIEAVKETLRIAVLGVAAFLVSAILAKLKLMEQSDLLVVLFTLLFRGADKWLHKSGVTHGLTRF